MKKGRGAFKSPDDSGPLPHGDNCCRRAVEMNEAKWPDNSKEMRRFKGDTPAERWLEEAVEYIDSFKERFRRLKELAPVIKAIDRVLKKVRPKGRKAA